MNRKRMAFAAMIAIVLAGAVVADAQTKMKNGESAIYLKSGDVVIDRIRDISDRRFVLETDNSGEFPLRNIWMINFIDDAWDFPGERDQLQSDDHYVFLRNGAISAGKIIDFSSTRRVFQFAGGEEFPIGQVRRIYFSASVPNSLSGQGGYQPGSPNIWAGTFAREYPAPLELILRQNGTAQMTLNRGMVGGAVLTGTWRQLNAGSIQVNMTSSFTSKEPMIMTFGLEKDTLISLSGPIGQNVRLQRRY